MFGPAVKAASSAKSVLLVLTLSYMCRNSSGCEAEGYDRPTIDLPGQQVALAQALAAATKQPLVCLLIHGSGVRVAELLTACDALVDAYYPGIQGGNGVADVLFGKYNPAGRTPQTYYPSNDSLPAFGQMNLYAGNGLTYRHFKPQVRRCGALRILDKVELAFSGLCFPHCPSAFFFFGSLNVFASLNVFPSTHT